MGKKLKRLKKRDLGHCVRVEYDDIGTIDAVLVQFDEDYADVWCFATRDLDRVCLCQITSVGKYLIQPIF